MFPTLLDRTSRIECFATFNAADAVLARGVALDRCAPAWPLLSIWSLS